MVGFRSAAAFPEPLLSNLCLHILRVSHNGSLKVESLVGTDFKGESANHCFLMIYHGRITLLQLPEGLTPEAFVAPLETPPNPAALHWLGGVPGCCP